VTLIVRRWQDFSGGFAISARNGTSFDATE
jgi:hypothetical protein